MVLKTKNKPFLLLPWNVCVPEAVALRWFIYFLGTLIRNKAVSCSQTGHSRWNCMSRKAPNKLGTSDWDCSPTQQGLSNTRETSTSLNSSETQVTEGGGLLSHDSSKADHLPSSQGNTRRNNRLQKPVSSLRGMMRDYPSRLAALLFGENTCY